MKALVANNNWDVRHVIQSSQLMPRSTRLAMKPLTYATDRLKFSEVKPLFKKGDKTDCTIDPFHF